jgi:hypothetical protein
VAGRTYGKNEMNRVTDKVEAFADDNNILALLENIAIFTIKTVLSSFAILSGLRCNVDKSQILVFGTEVIPDFISESGFTVSNEIKILGFKITKNHQDIAKNFEPAVEKIKKSATFWSRFKLSLPGRINVAKTLMLSQVGFHASILSIPEEKITETQQVIDRFVTGNFKFDKKLICMKPSLGGLGMINIKNYIDSLHCSWVKKAVAAPIDSWRDDLYKMSGGKFSPLCPNDNCVPIRHPILSTLNDSFWRFKNVFFSMGKNFFESRFGGNPRLINNRREKLPVNLNHTLRHSGADCELKIKMAKISELTPDGQNFIELAELCQKLGTFISGDDFTSLKNIVKDSWLAIKKFSKKDTGFDLEDFMSRPRKGSKRYRSIFDEYDETQFSIQKNKRVSTFFRLVNLPIPDNSTLEVLWGQWTLCSYNVKLREFCFKFRNNILGINTRVAHFNANISRGCTFCTLNRVIPIPDEDFMHVFFYCPSVNLLLSNFCNRLLLIHNLDDCKKIFFTGLLQDAVGVNLFILTVTSVILFYIWQCKLQKKIPTYEAMLNELYFTTDAILKLNSLIRDDMNLNLPLCRNWPAESGRRQY